MNPKLDRELKAFVAALMLVHNDIPLTEDQAQLLAAAYVEWITYYMLNGTDVAVISPMLFFDRECHVEVFDPQEAMKKILKPSKSKPLKKG